MIRTLFEDQQCKFHLEVRTCKEDKRDFTPVNTSVTVSIAQRGMAPLPIRDQHGLQFLHLHSMYVTQNNQTSMSQLM